MRNFGVWHRKHRYQGLKRICEDWRDEMVQTKDIEDLVLVDTNHPVF